MTSVSRRLLRQLVVREKGERLVNRILEQLRDSFRLPPRRARSRPQLEGLERREVPTAITWKPTVGVDFNNGNNWVLTANTAVVWGTAPAAGDDLTFNGGVSNAGSNITANATVNSLNVQAGYTGTISTLTLTLSVSGNCNLAGGVLTIAAPGGAGDGTVNFNGPTSWSGTPLLANTNSTGAFNFNANSQASGTTGLTCTGFLFINSTFDWSNTFGLSTLTIAGAASGTVVVNSGGTLTVNQSATFLFNGGTTFLIDGSLNIASSKTLTVTGTHVATAGTVTLDYYGRIDCNVDYEQTGSLSETIMDQGATINCATVVYDGEFYASNATGGLGTAWTIGGDFTMVNSGALLEIGHGSDASGTSSYVPVFHVTGDYSGGAGTLQIDGAMWTAIGVGGMGGGLAYAVPEMTVTGKFDASGPFVFDWLGTPPTHPYAPGFTLVSYGTTRPHDWSGITLGGGFTGVWDTLTTKTYKIS
jgi:hypothetical protein